VKNKSSLANLLQHVTNYSFGSILVTAAGFISFPILTRLLTTGEYGLLSLIAVTLSLLVAIGKLGLQNPIIRFYSDARNNKGKWNIENFYSTVVFGMLGIGAAATILWILLVFLAPESWWNDQRLKALFIITAVLVIVRIMESAFANILRARQKSKLLVTYRVVRKYAILLAVVTTLYFLLRNLTGLYIATIFGETIAVLILAVIVLRNIKLNPTSFSPDLLKHMLLFGIPLVGNELAWILLNIGDRYLIQGYLGATELGAYAAAYNVSDYIRIALIMSLYQALPPIYIRMWNEKGEEETRKFIEKSLHFYILVGFPVIAGLSITGHGLLTILATEKFSSGSVIIPYVIAGMVINGSVAFFSAGLYIHKKGNILMLLTLLSATVNVILNIILIPRYGIEGAAIATLASFMLLATSNKVVSSNIFNINIPWVSIIKFGSASIFMYVVLSQLKTGNLLGTLVLQVITGTILYALTVLAIDSHARNIAKDYIRKFVKI